MPYGFFTIEQWTRPRRGGKPQWVPVRHLDAFHSLTDALETIEDLGRPGFYRIVQTQRMVWAQKEKGKLRLRRWHASTPEVLGRTAAAFDQDGGKWSAAPETAGKRR